MQRLSLILSIVAAGLAGWFAWDASNLRAEMKRLKDDLDAQAVVEARVGVLEKAAAAKPAAPSEAPRPADASRAPDGTTLAGTSSAPAPRASATAVTLEDLQKRVAALERGSEGVAGSGAPSGAAGALERALRARGDGPAMKWGALNFYGSVDDAAKDLDLSSGQKSDFERAVADAKRDLDELHKVPDDEGRTWDDAQKDMIKVDGSGIKLDTSKLQAFRSKTVPGRNETFGAADTRIRSEAKARMRNSLTSEQQSKFDKANADPLLGGGGGGVTYSVFTSPVEATSGK